MLQLVESRSEKVTLQRKFESIVRGVLPELETRLVGWRPHSRRMRISHDGCYWYKGVSPESDQKIPRYWNSFGKYERSKKLPISIEINIATTTNNGRISAFFARDAETGIVCLMHDGGVGGGKLGVSKTNFLAWLDPERAPVAMSNGDIRRAILITPLESNRAGEDILRFVQRVIDFKQAVDDGYKGPAGGHADDADDYYDEPAGKRKRRRIRELEYESRHGDIVRALRDWRAKGRGPSERMTKTRFIDLGVKVAGELKEIYEVKSGCRRSYIYGGIGQLLVHEAANARSKRFLVLPDAEGIKPDLGAALARNRISVIRFHLNCDKVTILP